MFYKSTTLIKRQPVTGITDHIANLTAVHNALREEDVKRELDIT